MSKLAVVPARSPARARVAELIATRDRVVEVLEARRQDGVGWPYAFEEREARLEAEIRSASSSASSNDQFYKAQTAAAARTAALLRGEEPPKEKPTGAELIAALRAELEALRAEARASRVLSEKKRADVHALGQELGNAIGRIEVAAREVVAAECGRAALLAEYEFHAARAAILARALDHARPAPDLSAARTAALAAPCPWAAAAERLRTDPDAPIPTVEAVFASVGGKSSNRDAA